MSDSRGREAETVVLMSVYAKDKPEHFRGALRSLLQQSYRDFDVFLMLDGAVSVGLLSVVEQAGDDRVFVFRSTSNQGLAVSLNCLIDEALLRGYRYLARMDADDEALPARLSTQVEYLQRNPTVDVVGTDCEEIDEAGIRLCIKSLPTEDAQLKRSMLRRCPFVHPSVMFRRRVFETGVRYATGTHLTEDMFLWVDLAKRGYVFANIPEPLLRYRVDSRFYERRRGARKALSEFRAKRYIARELEIRDLSSLLVPPSAFVLRMLPVSLLKLCYRYLR